MHAQITRAGSNRTYHLVVSLHPETFRIHAPAWDHQKLFTAGRALEAELGLTPLRSMARGREKLPQRAADCEAHQGIDSFARWAGRTLAPALRATELRSWDDLHEVCGRFGVVLRLHGNGLVFEDAERQVRVKASCVGREFGKPPVCQPLGDFRPASVRPFEASGRAAHRYSASRDRQRLKEKYRLSGRDRKRLSEQLALHQAIESRALRRKLANQRKVIKKQRGLLAALPETPHPGTWRHFVASRAAHGDTRAIRLRHRREQERSPWDLARGS